MIASPSISFVPWWRRDLGWIHCCTDVLCMGTCCAASSTYISSVCLFACFVCWLVGWLATFLFPSISSLSLPSSANHFLYFKLISIYLSFILEFFYLSYFESLFDNFFSWRISVSCIIEYYYSIPKRFFSLHRIWNQVLFYPTFLIIYANFLLPISLCSITLTILSFIYWLFNLFPNEKTIWTNPYSLTLLSTDS